MKLTVLQENLHKGLSTASRFVASRAQLPVLGNLLLATEKGRLKISATNLETGVVLSVGANVTKEGSLTVPSRLLTEYVATLPAGKLELEAKETQLKISGSTFKAEFIGLPAGEFPAMPKIDEKGSLAFPGKILTETVEQVAFAAAVDEGRPVLTGVLFILKDGELQVVATDGYRLSLKKIKAEKDLAEREELKKGLLLPARTLIEVARLVNESSEEMIRLAITPESNQVIFGMGEAMVISRLVEGEFPDYMKIVPPKGIGKVEMDREELTRAVKTAAILARESANIIHLKVGKSTVTVSSGASQTGSNETDVEAKVEGTAEGIAFNSRYLLDYLGAVDAEKIILEVSTSLSPGVFTISKDAAYLHIIMPVRVQE
jgi:DNA polymerase-3 subunit beta